MATYRVKDPTGQLHEIQGPDNASPDEILSQAQKLIPSQGQSIGKLAGQAALGGAKEALFRPGTMSRDFITNPVTQAKALPYLTGMLGGGSPIPGGATLGTVGGRQLSNLALKTYGKPEEIPSGTQQIIEGLTSAAGDVFAIPMMKKAYFGKQIGNAEKAAGLITRPPMKAVTPGSVGETLNNLEAQLDSGTINTPQAARDAKAVINQVYRNPKIYEMTDDIRVTAARTSRKVQDLLNSMVPGRLAPAQGMAKSQIIPNTAKKLYKKLPWQAKLGGLSGLGYAAQKQIREMLGF